MAFSQEFSVVSCDFFIKSKNNQKYEKELLICCVTGFDLRTSFRAALGLITRLRTTCPTKSMNK